MGSKEKLVQIRGGTGRHAVPSTGMSDMQVYKPGAMCTPFHTSGIQPGAQQSAGTLSRVFREETNEIHILPINNSYIYSEYVAIHGVSLHRKKSVKFKMGMQYRVAINQQYSSNPRTARKQLGGCGQSAQPICASVSYLKDGNNNSTYIRSPQRNQCDFRCSMLGKCLPYRTRAPHLVTTVINASKWRPGWMNPVWRCLFHTHTDTTFMCLRCAQIISLPQNSSLGS